MTVIAWLLIIAGFLTLPVAAHGVWRSRNASSSDRTAIRTGAAQFVLVGLFLIGVGLLLIALASTLPLLAKIVLIIIILLTVVIIKSQGKKRR